MGTAVPGTGTSARHASKDRAVAGRMIATGLAAKASDPDRTNADADVGESLRSDAAQQLSACVWLTTLFAPGSCESDLCIGHVPPSAQQAIRASGVAFQPAHTAKFATHNAKTAETAATRLLKFSTSLGCSTGARVSNAPARPAVYLQRGAVGVRQLESQAKADA